VEKLLYEGREKLIGIADRNDNRVLWVTVVNLSRGELEEFLRSTGCAFETGARKRKRTEDFGITHLLTNRGKDTGVYPRRVVKTEMWMRLGGHIRKQPQGKYTAPYIVEHAPKK